MYAVGFLLLLGPLVTLHELGHYLVGRWFGVKADVFSVGFGKEIAGFTDRRGTRWKLGFLPLGGYVQFAGDMNPASQPSEEWLNLPHEERAQTFQSKTLWQRALIVAAGPLTNLLIALVIFAGFAIAYGKPVTPPVIEMLTKDAPAAAAGLQLGDRIVAIDGKPIEDFRDVPDLVVPYPGRTIAVTYDRGGEQATIPVRLASEELVDRFGNKAKVGVLGVGSHVQRFERVGLLEAGAYAVDHSVTLVKLTITGIGQIVTGQRSVRELGGPVKMAKFAGERLSLGPLDFVDFLGFVSINLAFINLLPIPALDGGHLAFYAAQAVRRKPASIRSQEWAFRTGIAFVLALMLFVTINDIASLSLFGG
jgi:regulator of sigma E protease